MTEPDPKIDVPISQLSEQERAKRAASFGAAAPLYERYRPGPSELAVDWILPGRVATVIDLGAGTGALTRLLLTRAEHVVAVEPDDRMRALLTERVPGARAVMGRGESIPIPDRTADAVVASSSWHWMDPVPTLREVARVLAPGGTLGVLWSGPDPEGPFMIQALALLGEMSRAPGRASSEDPGSEFASLLMAEDRPAPRLEIPAGSAFDQPESRVFTWDVALNADELIGLLGTFSWVITLPDETRARVTAEARRLLRDALGVEGDVTVDVGFRSDAWRTHLQ